MTLSDQHVLCVHAIMKGCQLFDILLDKVLDKTVKHYELPNINLLTETTASFIDSEDVSFSKIEFLF